MVRWGPQVPDCLASSSSVAETICAFTNQIFALHTEHIFAKLFVDTYIFAREMRHWEKTRYYLIETNILEFYWTHVPHVGSKCVSQTWSHVIMRSLNMITSSNGNIMWNSSVTGEFPAQRPVTRRFDVYLDLRLNKRLSKHSIGWWSETPSPPS